MEKTSQRSLHLSLPVCTGGSGKLRLFHFRFHTSLQLVLVSFNLQVKYSEDWKGKNIHRI